MSKLNLVNNHKAEEKITYCKKVVDNIIYVAISEIPYVELAKPSAISQKKPNKSIKITYNNKTISVDVDVKIHSSQSISETAFRIQEAIKHSIESMTEYVVNDVNVNVLDVLFDSAMPEVTDEKPAKKLSKNIEIEDSKEDK